MESHSQETAYRILDASANRVAEGLRTIEEFFRFGLDDPVGTESIKSLRHDLTLAFGKLSRQSLLHSRNTDADVGTTIESPQEYRRSKLSDVLAAAAGRIQQSLRVTEEYGKTIDPIFAKQIESIRYRAYTLLKDCELKAIRSDRTSKLTDAALYVLIDCQKSDQALVDSVLRLHEAGVDVFQLRDKSATDRTLIRRGTAAAEALRQTSALLIINDRADIALITGADGVHVGQDELTVAQARRIVGDELLVGVSTHDINQVHEAIAAGADYIGCGPTFPSRTKAFASHAGLDFLAEVHRETKATPRPAFAIGGIDEDNVSQVLDQGFHRIAVTAAIHEANDPAAAATELRKKLCRE
ncbi:thiamine phosphate synthase [Roseiconus lacunae]|uniref:thiamine phosphate synthase n=1 Tax=Roseiconus lacunae TaxID=2605694 RepID=UPI001E41501F|nr:thiamine phosphate synthase [Roseiconus lacunae]MCD0461892.1 thiamine phosphate synthase [Roseiconus lacunae]